ncbi:FAD/NAD(P)-binding domain-containing protein [Setomelanomma holmii]|uniref:FAD/NAD(P)-binding domain-containing protein n=1 Tax=Setomelanomma holmii TaxID=210430 RepID=A0A9P4H2E9_9PLEO|nr:FAD/NAD(P)-binding domain-containing protein [Setomelanomma holmii]
MRVLISGAGVAGPTLALLLAKAGMCCTVLEKSKALLPHGQNVDLQGSAVTVVKKMGLMEEVRRRNTKEKGSQFIDSDGKPFAPFPIDKGSAASLTSEFEILRGDLSALLYEATKDHPAVDYLFGTTIKRIISNDERCVKIELSSGDVEEYDLLVAADGQWSRVRKLFFPCEDVKSVEMGSYSVYYTVPRILSDNDWWNIYLTSSSRLITLRPDPYGTTRAMFSLMPCNKAQHKEWFEAGRSDRQTQQKLQIKMSRWSNSRVVCLGDAAYAPSPLTGMGTSLAIVGAYVLAGELSKLSVDEHPSKALRAYEDKFRPFVDEVQKVPFFVPGIMHPNTVRKRWLLHGFLRGFSKIVAVPWVRRRLGDPGNSEDFPLQDYTKFVWDKSM